VSGAGWPDLIDELDRWGEAERVATLWWRDDDAVAPTLALDHLLSINEAVPVALAVIPANATLELAAWARSFNPTRMVVLQHGWRHVSHSGDLNKSEFPADRPAEQIVRELVAGRVRLIQLFGPSALPVLVPPWNRFDDGLLPLLSGCGFSAISRAKPRRTERPITGITEANVHLDLVAWREGRGFIGEKAALGGLIAHLEARRHGLVCSTEPTGILTHHLVREAATDAFLHRLFDITNAHRAVCWLDAAKVFSSARLVPA
jgi:hypothetical protein